MSATRAMRWSVLGLGLALLLHAACNGTSRVTPKQRHVLNRIGYGPDAWSLARIQQLGSTEAYIEEQLHPELLDDTALEAEIASLYPVQTMSWGVMRHTYHEYTGNPETGPYAPIRDSTRAKILRTVKSKRQLEQVLVDFWFNHFSVDANVDEARWGFVTLERDAIRPNVFGSFETMLKATAKNPGMLDYLDNMANFREGFVYQGTPSGINENYARELMELHTIGVDGGYTQNDVREVARAFTGWTTIPPFSSLTTDGYRWLPLDGFQFLPEGHDMGAKSIMGALSLPANRGIVDGEDVIHFLATHPKTAERISRKLCQRFVSESPPEPLVQATAAIFLATNGDLRQVMRTILLSPEFLGVTYANTKVKRPLVFAASLARVVGIRDDAIFAPEMDSRLQRMGEALYRAGPPTGYPESSRYWAGEGPFIGRISLASQAALGNSGLMGVPPVAGSTPADIVEQLRIQYLRSGPLEPGSRAALEALAQSLPSSERVRQTAATLFVTPNFLVH